MRRMLVLGCMGLLAAGCSDAGKKPDASLNPPPSENSPDIADVELPDINSQTYIAAGDLASTRGHFIKAAEQYEKALKLKEDPAIVRKLALTYAKAGRTNESINTWKRYLSVTHYSSDGYGSLGYAYELAGNPAEAEKTYREGVAKHPKGSLVRINYGLMLVRSGKVEDAVTQLSAVLQAHEVNYNIASVYEQLGRRDLAQFYYRKSLECNPQFTPAKQKLKALG